MKVGYAFCYLYAALCPSTGHLLCLILPDMSKASFCVFCRFFSEQVQTAWGTQPVLLICDGAGAHQKQVCLQQGINLQHLPPYSPELNPVERFYEELRKDLSNQVYENIEEAENHLQKVLQPYFSDKEKIIQLTNYSYIRTD
jgi:transposase